MRDLLLSSLMSSLMCWMTLPTECLSGFSVFYALVSRVRFNTQLRSPLWLSLAHCTALPVLTTIHLTAYVSPFQAYMILRSHSDFIISLFGMMLSTGLKDVSSEEDLRFLHTTLVRERRRTPPPPPPLPGHPGHR